MSRPARGLHGCLPGRVGRRIEAAVLSNPGPVKDHVTDGFANGWPNWSCPVTVNCCVLPAVILAKDGLTAMLASDWFTVTLTELVVDWPPKSVTVTRKL